MVVNYMHHGDDLVEHRTREASFGAQCTNHSPNSMCFIFFFLIFSLKYALCKSFMFFFFSEYCSMLSVPANHEKHSDTIHVWQGCCNTLFLLSMIFACQQQYHPVCMSNFRGS